MCSKPLQMHHQEITNTMGGLLILASLPFVPKAFHVVELKGK